MVPRPDAGAAPPTKPRKGGPPALPTKPAKGAAAAPGTEAGKKAKGKDTDPDEVTPHMPWKLVARATRRPVPAADYLHACRASRPGFLPWLVEALLLLWAAAQFRSVSRDWLALAPGPFAWLKAPMPGPLVALVAVAIAGLFWLVGWEWRRTPRGILLGLGDRNVASLSIAQALAWTVLLVAFTLVALLFSTPSAVDDLGALQSGLGVGTAAGTVLALGGKTDPALRPTDKAVARTAKAAVQKDADAYIGDLLHHTGAALDLQDARNVLGRPLPSTDQPAAAPPDPATQALGAAATSRAVGGLVGKELAGDLLGRLAGGEAVGTVLDDVKSGATALVRDADKARQDEVQALLGSDKLPALLGSFASDLAGHVEGQLKGDGDGPGAAAALLYRNRCACEARLTDMLQGDEVGNTYQLDVHKLQFLALTLLGLVTLVWVWLHRVGHPFGLQATYPGGILASVGLSSAAYVGAKLPVQTPLAPEA